MKNKAACVGRKDQIIPLMMVIISFQPILGEMHTACIVNLYMAVSSSSLS